MYFETTEKKGDDRFDIQLFKKKHSIENYTLENSLRVEFVLGKRVTCWIYWTVYQRIQLFSKHAVKAKIDKKWQK